MNKKLYLIDGMSIVFRAYHAMKSTDLRNKNGEPTGAIFGFVNIITSFLEKESPEYMAIVFDTEHPTFRKELYDQYKANRDSFPEDLAPQLLKIKKFIHLVGIEQIEVPGFEADDVIGTIAKKASKEGYEVLCLTSDKDYYQLVDEKISLMKPSRKGEEFEIIRRSQVFEKFGVKPEQVVDVLALIGDTSDNVPGVKGIGERTAIPLVQEFGSIEEIYNNLDKIEKSSIRSKLENDRENAFLAKKLVTIDTNIEKDFNLEEMKLKNPDYYGLDKFFEELSFVQIRQKWQQKGNISLHFDTMNNSQLNDIDKIQINYHTVSNSNIREIIQYLSSFETIAFDIETDSLDRQTCEIVGVSFAVKAGEAFYFPISQRKDKNIFSNATTLFDFSNSQVPNIQDKNESEIPFETAISELKKILENPKIAKCGQNAKFDAFILKRFGINVHPITFDTMVADYLLNPEARHNLDALSERWLNYKPIPISDLIGENKKQQISMREVPIDIVSKYACEDADLVIKLKNVLEKELEKANMFKLANEIEFPLVSVLTNMEYEGVKIDRNVLQSISVELNEEILQLKKKIFDYAGEEFNIDSPKQLGEILFDKLQIKALKKTKTGYSTDASVLAELAAKYPIAAAILEYRQLVKLKSTYVDALPELINPQTGKIHTSFNQTVASTGRLSSTDPNLQNIPVRTEKGREIRKAFVPTKENNVIISADYSQIELRVMAYISQDKNLIDAFKRGLDIHSATASLLFNIDIEKVDSTQRRVAKTVNFGILYGLGSFGLAQRLGISRTEASEIIDNYFKKYSAIKDYINTTIEFVRRNGYAETLCGRRRYFTDINSKNSNLRSAAERAAINMPIQGTASDMIKIAMIRIHNRLSSEGYKTRMIMQVHDELVFDAPEKELIPISQLIEREMSNALPLGDVPVAVDIGSGKNWFEAH
ncbi:MAG: DNA polymerase I [Bacteroidota bacterium]